MKGPRKGRTADRITVRCVIVGFVLALVHTVWLVYEEQTLNHLAWPFTTFVVIPSVLGIMFFMMVMNGVWRRWRPSLVFSPVEMMVVFIMTTVASVGASLDFTQFLVPVMMAAHVPAAKITGWDKLFQYIPKWFVPQDQTVVDGYYTGLHKFWAFFSPEIFRPWLLPLIFWTVFLVLIGFTTICFSSILRRQWVDREKLTFPIIELPMMMVRENTVGSLFKNRLLLVGFAITSMVLSMNYLSSLYPAIPQINLQVTNIAPMIFVNPPLCGMNPIMICWWPFAIGLCYLMPLDISFSSWFFYILLRLTMAVGTAMGWRDPNAGFSPDQFPYIYNLAQGAWVGIFGVVMWSARGHLKQIFNVALGREKLENEDREPMPYRFAAFGALLGFTLLVAMTAASGLRLHLALIFFTVYMLALVVMTRIYAQIAVPIFELYFFSSISLATNLTGAAALTHQDATVLTHFHWMDRCYRQHWMGHQMESVVFADRQGQSPRLITKIVMLALVTGIVLGLLTVLQIMYDRGSQGSGENIARAEAWGRLMTWITNTKPVQGTTLLKIGISTLVVALLAIARSIWFGFPLHPIGYGFACGYAMEYIWNIVFVTWLIKLLVLRYGGLKLYRRSLPLFFGIVLGDAVTQFTWSIALALLGIKGAQPYGRP